MANCKSCGKKCYNEYCFACKPKKPIGQKTDKVRMPTKPLKKISDKRKAQEAVYTTLRKTFMEHHPNCHICGSPSTDIHHVNSRENERLNDTKHWLSICRPCHNEIHANPIWARDNGYLI